MSNAEPEQTVTLPSQVGLWSIWVSDEYVGWTPIFERIENGDFADKVRKAQRVSDAQQIHAERMLLCEPHPDAGGVYRERFYRQMKTWSRIGPVSPDSKWKES